MKSDNVVCETGCLGLCQMVCASIKTDAEDLEVEGKYNDNAAHDRDRNL